MKSKIMKLFKERAAGDGNLINRANFRENYAEFEKYCNEELILHCLAYLIHNDSAFIIATRYV